MSFYLNLDAELAGDRNSETGFPGRVATDRILDGIGIRSPLNREIVRRMLAELATGRNEGRNEHVEPEKK